VLPSLAVSHGFNIEETLIEQATAIPLPHDWDTYLNSLSAHDRKETRRKLRNAESAGARLIRDDTALTHCLDLMQSHGGEKSDAVQVTMRPLLENAGPSLIREGVLELYKLEIEGHTACCLLQFATPQGPMLYNIGFDRSMQKWSPGAVAIAMSIRNAIAAGFAKYDLLRGNEPYKYRLGAVNHPLYRLTLTRAKTQ
jgi:hypothetical protein